MSQYSKSEERMEKSKAVVRVKLKLCAQSFEALTPPKGETAGMPCPAHSNRRRQNLYSQTPRRSLARTYIEQRRSRYQREVSSDLLPEEADNSFHSCWNTRAGRSSRRSWHRSTQQGRPTNAFAVSWQRGIPQTCLLSKVRNRFIWSGLLRVLS